MQKNARAHRVSVYNVKTLKKLDILQFDMKTMLTKHFFHIFRSYIDAVFYDILVEYLI